MQLIRPEIEQLQAYQTAKSDTTTTPPIKLDAMESPYLGIDFSNSEVQQWISSQQVNRYPDSNYQKLTQAVAQYFNLNPDNLLFGNGSDELIQLINLTFGKPGDAILSVEPSFAVYRLSTIAAAKQYIEVPLNNDFTLNIEAMLQAIEQHQPIITYIAYPNNPTGNRFPRTQIETILNTSKGIVVLDEAYFAFSNDSMLDALEYYPNLIVLRTFSKIGFAGLRVGILVAHNQWIKQLNKLRLPYNISSLSQTLLCYALTHPEKIEQHRQQILTEKQQLIQALQSLLAETPIKLYPSETNFILLQVQTSNKLLNHQIANRIEQYLKQHNILIRNFSKPDNRLNGCLRISVGSAEENQQFLQYFTKIIKSEKPTFIAKSI